MLWLALFIRHPPGSCIGLWCCPYLEVLSASNRLFRFAALAGGNRGYLSSSGFWWSQLRWLSIGPDRLLPPSSTHLGQM